jgi:dihydrofolate reductase
MSSATDRGRNGMTKLRVHCLSMSLDGYVAGPDQSLDNPLGVGGERLHDWAVATRTGREIILGQPGGTEGVDDGFMVRGFDGIGATIMGRNMFGPVRGEWAPVAGEEWRGWWGPEPPYHHPVFVLTHHAHDPIEMDGGTTFFFVTDGIEAALDRARAAAGEGDIRLGGGAATVREYLRAGLVDDVHVAIAPVLLGAGERLFDDLAEVVDRYECVGVTAGEGATHVQLTAR